MNTCQKHKWYVTGPGSDKVVAVFNMEAGIVVEAVFAHECVAHGSSSSYVPITRAPFSDWWGVFLIILMLVGPQCDTLPATGSVPGNTASNQACVSA
jgi:hypothetical protein